jgi:hypothetical protein
VCSVAIAAPVSAAMSKSLVKGTRRDRDDKSARRQLYRALEAHRFDLEIMRSVASGFDLKTLDRRMEAVRLLLEWLSQAPGLEPLASPAAQMPPP